MLVTGPACRHFNDC